MYRTCQQKNFGFKGFERSDDRIWNRANSYARWFRLAEWGQDEVVADPLPLSLTLENITLHIEDDRPPAAPGLPSAPPLDLSVPARLRVARDRFGVVNICGAEMTEKRTVTERAELSPSKVNVREVEVLPSGILSLSSPRDGCRTQEYNLQYRQTPLSPLF
jgi:hypothetical protein